MFINTGDVMYMCVCHGTRYNSNRRVPSLPKIEKHTSPIFTGIFGIKNTTIFIIVCNWNLNLFEEREHIDRITKAMMSSRQMGTCVAQPCIVNMVMNLLISVGN